MEKKKIMIKYQKLKEDKYVIYSILFFLINLLFIIPIFSLKIENIQKRKLEYENYIIIKIYGRKVFSKRFDKLPDKVYVGREETKLVLSDNDYQISDEFDIRNRTIKLEWTYPLTWIDYMFYNNDEVQQIDLSHFDISQLKSIFRMFYNAQNLTSVNFPFFDVSYTIDMNCLFCLCQKLQFLDLSNFNTSLVESMSFMFYGCESLTSLDLSNFNTSSVKNMDNIFMVVNH